MAEENAVSRMQQIESIGKEQYQSYVSERLVKREIPIDEPIKRNKLDFFATVNSSIKFTIIIINRKRSLKQ